MSFCRTIYFLICIFALSSCSSLKNISLTEGLSLVESLSMSEGVLGFKSHVINIKEIEFIVDRDANSQKAIPADLIVVYKSGPISTIMKMTAIEYFSNRKGFIEQNAGTIEVRSFELVPGGSTMSKIKLSGKRPIAAFLFVHYWNSDSINRFRIGSGKKYIVGLHSGTVIVNDSKTHFPYIKI